MVREEAGVEMERGYVKVDPTLQTNVSGVWVQSAVPDANAGTFTIYLNKAPGTKSHPLSVTVAWFVLS